MQDPPSRARMITHGNTEKEWAQIWQVCGQACRACDEEAEEGNVAAGAWWKRGQGKEQEAGDRDRTFGGAQEGREGSIEAEIERRTQAIQWSQEDGWPKEAGVEAKVGWVARSSICREEGAKRTRYAQGRDGDAAALGTSANASTLQGCATRSKYHARGNPHPCS
jgi:hypothetical protein